MTEEKSVLGLPEYPNFMNNNDDQTAMSLVFKKYGFQPFPHRVRDYYFLTGRNLANCVS